MTRICDNSLCTGCGACYSVCPKKAISMEENAYGFLYPQISDALCINCHLCEKHCPVNNKVDMIKPTNVYAAINKNNYDYETTTSGGIATLLSRKIISENGVVYGAALNDKISVSHIRIDNDKDIEKIKGSKYVQSIIGDVYVNIKADLNNDKTVLFIGTPCQVVGLNSYLGCKYNNLFTCDIVCHGVPSAKMLNEHLDALGVSENITSVTFRDKQGYYLTVYNSESLKYRKRNFRDVFYLGFLKGLFYRDCCYSCIYANSSRTGDITLGDFWGFDSEKGKFPVKTNCGLSLVMINTKNGKKLFDSSSYDIVFLERTLEEAANGNKQLRHPSIINKNHSYFMNNYHDKGFEKSASNALWKERLIYGMLDRIGK